MDLVSARWGEMDPEAHLASFLFFVGRLHPLSPGASFVLSLPRARRRPRIYIACTSRRLLIDGVTRILHSKLLRIKKGDVCRVVLVFYKGI